MAIAQVRTVKNVLFFSKSDKEAIRKNAGKMAAILCNHNLLEGFDKLDISEYYLLREISPIFEEMDECYYNTEEDVDAERVLIVTNEIKAFLATLPPQKIEVETLLEAFEGEDSIINEELDQYGDASDLLYQLLLSTISDEAKQEIVDTIFN